MNEHFLAPDDPAQPLELVWPPFGLRIRSPRLSLRVLRETDFPEYVAAATSGVTHSKENPFAYAWNEKSPTELVRGSLPYIYSTRARITPTHWHLPLAVFTTNDDGEESQLIGMQDVEAHNWDVMSTVSSGSWLRADHHGQGFGTEMRAAVLLWAFDHFDAEYAESAAYSWNLASHRVSEKLGYFTSGTRRVTDAHGEQPVWERMFRLPKDDFLRPAWLVQVSGSAELSAFLRAT